MNWDHVFQLTSVDDMCDEFIAIIEPIYNQFFLSRQFKEDKKALDNMGMLGANTVKKCKNQDSLDTVKKYSIYLTNFLCQRKRRYFHGLFSA